MYPYVPIQLFISQRLITHVLHKHILESISVNTWEIQRVREVYKVRLTCTLLYKSKSIYQCVCSPSA